MTIVRQLEWLSDPDADLLLIVDDDGLLGYDLRTGQSSRLRDDRHVVRIGPARHDGRVFVVSTNRMKTYQIERTEDVWTAREVADAHRRPTTIIEHISWSWDDRLVAWSDSVTAVVYDAETLDRLAYINLHRTAPNHNGFDWLPSQLQLSEDEPIDPGSALTDSIDQ